MFYSQKAYSRNKEVCHNPSLGLVTKARACKGANQEGSPGVTSHAPGNEKECEGSKECEGMNPHTPKWALILGVGFQELESQMDSRVFKGRL
jgi:hypothetical protein